MAEAVAVQSVDFGLEFACSHYSDVSMTNPFGKFEWNRFESLRTIVTRFYLGCRIRRRLYSAVAAETKFDFVPTKRRSHQSVEAVTFEHL